MTLHRPSKCPLSTGTCQTKPLTSLVGDVSTCRGRQFTPILSSGQHAGNKKLRSPQLKMGHTHHTSLQGSGIFMKDAGKTPRPRGGGALQRSGIVQTQQGARNSRQLSQHTQELSKCQPNKTLPWTGEGGREITPVAKDRLALQSCWDRDTVSFNFVSTRKSTTLQGELHSHLTGPGLVGKSELDSMCFMGGWGSLKVGWGGSESVK